VKRGTALALCLGACWSSRAPSPEHADTTSQVTASRDAGGSDADPDPDHDRIVGDCDLCPDRPETFNGYFDEDGCPDKGLLPDPILAHPTNRYAGPELVIAFSGTQPTSSIPLLAFEPDVDFVAVVGLSSNSLTEANARAKAVASVLRTSARTPHVTEYAAAPGHLYDDPDVPEPADGAIVQVMSTKNVVVWDWQHDRFVRVAPPKKNEYPPELPAHCITAPP
jgi:hypothetical protein